MSKHRFRGRIALSGFILFLSCYGSALSQTDEPSPTTKSRGALYYLGEQDELLMRVNIWGFVRQPGQYMVPKDIDLISLISFAGGPSEQAKIKKIKVIRNDNVQASTNGVDAGVLAMTDAAGGQAVVPARKRDAARDFDGEVFEVNVKKYLKTGDASLIPELKPGDTIVVEGSTLHTVTKVLDFTARIAVVVNLYYLLRIAGNR